jgi:hypothetical protein
MFVLEGVPSEDQVGGRRGGPDLLHNVAGRATVALRERVAGMRHKLAVLAGSELGADELKHLTDIQEEIVERMPTVPELSPLQTSDREDKLVDWLDDNGVTSGWEIAPILVAGGVGVEDPQRVADALDDAYLDGAVRWLAYTVETQTLLDEIENATAASPHWSAPPSNTPRWTARRTNPSTSMTASTRRSSC